MISQELLFIKQVKSISFQCSGSFFRDKYLETLKKINTRATGHREIKLVNDIKPQMLYRIYSLFFYLNMHHLRTFYLNDL